MRIALFKVSTMAALFVCASAGTIALAGPAHDGHSTAGSVVPKFDKAVVNIPGKSVIAVEVNLAPGEVTAPHHHAKSAFILAYVLSGEIRSQLDGEPAKIYRAGDTWSEDPGAHHIQAKNMSKTKPAKLLAIFVVDTADKALTTFDAR